MKSVAGKNVLITGGAAGLGKLFATNAVREGAAKVVLWDINEAALKDTATELEALGGTVHTHVVNIADTAAIAKHADAVRAELGTMHVVFNNAGIVRGNSYFWQSDLADSDLTMAINSVGLMHVAHAFLPGMVDAGEECRLVNIASSAGLNAVPRMASYAASKWAALGFSDSVRLELEQAGHQHVKVTTVCPSYISTGMFDGASKMFLTPILKPEDVVRDVWKEMLKGGPFLITPWSSRLNVALVGAMPIKLRDRFLRAAGVYDSMANFTGHGKQ